MAFVYKQSDKRYSQPFDPKRCKASVLEPGRGWHPHQCQRKASIDGWCYQHHPNAEKERQEERRQRYLAKQKNSPSARIAKLKVENIQLRTENARLREELESLKETWSDPCP